MYLCKCIHFSILCCCYAAIFGTCFAVLNYINSLIHWLTEVAEASILAQLSATESRILNTQHRTAQNLFCNGLRHKPNILTLNKIWLGYLVDGLKHCPEVNVELSRPWKRYLKSDHCHLIYSVFCSLRWTLQKPRVLSSLLFFLLYFNHFSWFCTFCFWLCFFLTGNFAAYNERAVLLRKWKTERSIHKSSFQILKGKILVVTLQI